MIRRAITDNALVFIACFSSQSLAKKKSYQNEELALAMEQLRQRQPDDPWLIPVRFDECEVPDLDISADRTLASIQLADLFGGRYEEQMKRLVVSVQRLLGQVTARPGPGPGGWSWAGSGGGRDSDTAFRHAGGRSLMAESVRPDAVIRQVQNSLDRGAGLCLLAGAGLTISATGDLANSWPELIKRGAAACRQDGTRDRPWADRVVADVNTRELSDMLAAAEKVTLGLGGPGSERFATWLREAVGSLEPRNFELLNEVKRLARNPKVTVVTTNYDGLLARHLGLEWVTWKRDAPVLFDAASHVVEAVIHIHGHWLEPSSVVFGSASYAALAADKTALEALKKMLLANTVVAVGYGADTDPTFEALLGWADEALKQARAIFYLHLDGAKVPAHPGIIPVPLLSYSELATFLKQIQVKPHKPLLGYATTTDLLSAGVATLRRVRDLAGSARETRLRHGRDGS